MGQVHDIPFSALEAALLLKNGIVTGEDLQNLINAVLRIDRHYDVISDDYFEDLPSISNIVIDVVINGKTCTVLREGYTFNSVVDGKTVRNILEDCASYSGDVVLNYIGYDKSMFQKKENVLSKKSKGKSRIKSLFNHVHKKQLKMEF